MDINDLASTLAEKFNIDGLESTDNRLDVLIDDANILIEESDTGIFIITGIIGDPPSEGKGEFANILLQNNMALMNTKSSALAINPQSQSYVLIERTSEALDFEGFCECLAKFMDTLDMWRKMLADFAPAAAEAASISAEKETLTLESFQNGSLLV